MYCGYLWKKYHKPDLPLVMSAWDLKIATVPVKGIEESPKLPPNSSWDVAKASAISLMISSLIATLNMKLAVNDVCELDTELLR